MGMHADSTQCPIPSRNEPCDSPACFTILDTVPTADEAGQDDREQ